jgi:lipoyl-dependent peroxiredoxin
MALLFPSARETSTDRSHCRQADCDVIATLTGTCIAAGYESQGTKYWQISGRRAFVGSQQSIIMNRKASVVWKGTLREGAGTMTTESGVLSDTQYSFRAPFAEGIGTNPDELIAASLAGCFSMALSNELGIAGFHPQRIATTAAATLENLAAGWTVTRIQLDVRANVPDVSQLSFMEAALAAKTKCPIARLLNTNISMTASLNPSPQTGSQAKRSLPRVLKQTIRIPARRSGLAASVNSRNAKL